MYLAIDFGTSNTKAALVIEGQLILVRDPFKPESSFFPSSVYLTGEGQILVGHAADGMRDNDIHRYRKEFKRDLGGYSLSIGRSPIITSRFTRCGFISNQTGSRKNGSKSRRKFSD